MGFREEEGEESRERQEGKGTEGPEEGVEDMRAGKEEQAQEGFFCGVFVLPCEQRGGEQSALVGRLEAAGRREFCHLMATPCTFIRCFDRDKQGVSSK